jgi:hypothetical protein
MHIPPLQGYDDRLPLSTGRCPVLLMTGLSALLPPGVETVSKALFRHCELRGMKQEAIRNTVNHWIASGYALAMTELDPFETLSYRTRHATFLPKTENSYEQIK